MAWPLSQDYNEAIQTPQTSFADAELCQGQPVTNALGLPMPRSGQFADVYEICCPATQSRWAVKCFTRAVPDLRDRYREINSYLQQLRLPFFVDFSYLDQGIRVRGQWYPILKMTWVEGLLLNEFVRDKVHKTGALEALCQIWVRMGQWLRDSAMAHADLQHGNILLVPGSTPKALAVRLIDYDGLFVPALAGHQSGEAGHPAYQHPQRLLTGAYDAEVDRFPLLVILTALRALIVAGPALWQRYDNGDNLLFRESDLRAPAQSALCKELWKLPDAQTHALVGHLILSSRRPLAQTPLLHELMTEGHVAALSPWEEMGVNTLLGLPSHQEKARVESIPVQAHYVQRQAAQARAPEMAVLVAAPVARVEPAASDPRFDFEPPPLLMAVQPAGPAKWFFGVLALGLAALLAVMLIGGIWLFGSWPNSQIPPTSRTPHKDEKRVPMKGGPKRQVSARVLPEDSRQVARPDTPSGGWCPFSRSLLRARTSALAEASG